MQLCCDAVNFFYYCPILILSILVDKIILISNKMFLIYMFNVKIGVKSQSVYENRSKKQG